MVALGAVPAIVLMCLLPFCPESPRQLIYHDKHDEAAVVIQKVFPHGSEEQVQQKVRHIAAHVAEAKAVKEGKGELWLLKQLYVVPGNFRALIAACGLMAISQLGGFNSLMYYSSTLFALVGFANPVAVGTIIAATNFFFTWVNLMVVDRFGRRRILLSTMWGMALFLALAAVAFHWIPINHDLSLKDEQGRMASLCRLGLHDHLRGILLLGYGQHCMALFGVLPHGSTSIRVSLFCPWQPPSSH